MLKTLVLVFIVVMTIHASTIGNESFTIDLSQMDTVIEIHDGVSPDGKFLNMWETIVHPIGGNNVSLAVGFDLNKPTQAYQFDLPTVGTIIDMHDGFSSVGDFRFLNVWETIQLEGPNRVISLAVGFTVNTVPEPLSMLLVGCGLILCGYKRRKVIGYPIL